MWPSEESNDRSAATSNLRRYPVQTYHNTGTCTRPWQRCEVQKRLSKVKLSEKNDQMMAEIIHDSKLAKLINIICTPSFEYIVVSSQIPQSCLQYLPCRHDGGDIFGPLGTRVPYPGAFSPDSAHAAAYGRASRSSRLRHMLGTEGCVVRARRPRFDTF